MGLLKITAFRVPGVNAWAREKQFKLGHYQILKLPRISFIGAQCAERTTA